MPLSDWQNFYVIVGSSAGALTGLQFVVITLIAQIKTVSTMREIRAFATPTILHFCTSLFIAALMAAPWRSVRGLAWSVFVIGLAGVIYSFAVIWHARKSNYEPDAEDWLWYTAFPCLAHLLLLAVAILLWLNAPAALFLLAGDTLALLFLGIHNAWDSVTYIAVSLARRSAKPNQE
jgi:hypothetical protein